MLTRILHVDVESAEDSAELDQEKASKSVDILLIVNVAELDILIAVKLTHSLIQIMLFKVTLGHSD